LGLNRVVIGTKPSRSRASWRFFRASRLAHPTATLLMWSDDMAPD
jgi:hypothetical protein